jgi:DNA-binding GntR family transcriptional regulator
VAPPGKSFQLTAVSRISATEQVLREVRAAIIDGRLPPGEPLREVALAAELATGRTAVREAIRQLVQEGLVEHRPNRGAYVCEMSLADRLDVYVAREAIEVCAARRIIESAQELDLSTLRAKLEEMRAAALPGDGAGAGISERLIRSDIEFHEALVSLARSPRLTRTHATLLAETRMLLRHQPNCAGESYVASHEVLLAALAGRDASAPEMVAEHLRGSARLIADELERTAGEERSTESSGH